MVYLGNILQQIYGMEDWGIYRLIAKLYAQIIYQVFLPFFYLGVICKHIVYAS